MITFWRRIFQALVSEQVDYAKTKAAMEAVEDTFIEPQNPAAPLTYMLSAHVQAYTSRTEVEAFRRILRTASAILNSWSTTRKFPKVAPDLGLSSADPFSLKPLIYKRTAAGFILYSVGKDGQDDGGQHRNPKDSEMPFDIVFEYPRPQVDRSGLGSLTRPSWRPSAGGSR
jgi:hypothetical protein